MGLRTIPVTQMKYNNKNKESVKEAKDKKLRLLKEQFLQKSKELTKNNINKKTDPSLSVKSKKTDYDNSDNKYITENKLLKQKIVKYQKTIKTNELKLKKLQSKNSNLQLDISDAKEKMKEYEKIINGKENKILELNDEILHLKKELDSYNVRAFRILAKQCESMRLKYINHIKEREGLKNHLRTLKQSNIDNLDKIHELIYGEDCELNRDELAELKYKIKLEREEKQKALDYADKIQKDYKDKYLKIIQENIKLRNRISKYKSNSETFVWSNEYIGNIVIKQSFVFFKTTTGKILPANIDKVDKNIKDGIVCKAIKTKDKLDRFTIVKLFDEIDTIESAKAKDKKHKEEKTRNRILQDLKNNVDYGKEYNILIIGSRYKNEYMEAIKLMNLNCSWFDSYDENIVRLKKMESKYDIILCCTAHSRHYASDFIKYMINNHSEKPYKYNIVVGDSLKSMVGRVRYCIENMS